MSTVSHPLSVIVITRNEERNIADCLESVAWADDIVVVDGQSTDRTAEIARRFTDKVIVSEWNGYSAAKNLALAKVVNEWVFWLDADERVPPDLAGEIESLIAKGEAKDGAYEVARRAMFLDKWIMHCGWYPGYVVRLFRKNGARFSDDKVHEKIVVSSTVGRLRHDLLHYTDENLYHYLAKFNRYTTLAVEDMFAAGKRASMYDLLVRPAYVFVKMYLLRLGLLDGMRGLVLCLLSSAYVFTKYAKLRELENRQTKPGIQE